MKVDAHTLAAAAVVLGLALLSWWMVRVAREQPVLFTEAPRHEPDLVVEGYRIVTLNPDGSRKHQLSAERFTHYADDGSAELERPYLVQYGDGAPVHVRARRGWMPQSRAFIDMRGEVRMTRDRDPKSAGAELETEHLKIVLDRKQ